MITQRKLSPQALYNALTFAEVDRRLEPDCRRVLRGERESLGAALCNGDSQKIRAAADEALRVASEL